MATVATERKVFVGGEWVETGDWVEVRSPYSGDVVGRVAKAGAAETRRALDAAERALAEPLPAHKRAEILVKVAGLLGRRHEEVARTISDEAGKPIKAARVEAARAMSTYTFAAVEARKLAGEVVPMDATQAGEGKLAFTLRKPIGVVGAITPFNFPLNLVAHKLAPALAAGCAVVVKPAGQPRARKRDARHRRGGRGHRRRGGETGAACVLVRRPELHLRAAGLRAAWRVRRVSREFCSSRRGARGGRSRRRGNRCRPRD